MRIVNKVSIDRYANNGWRGETFRFDDEKQAHDFLSLSGALIFEQGCQRMDILGREYTYRVYKSPKYDFFVRVYKGD